jgi:16S rRNA (cytidine1402-2'-O)-methyltransferase
MPDQSHEALPRVTATDTPTPTGHSLTIPSSMIPSPTNLVADGVTEVDVEAAFAHSSRVVIAPTLAKLLGQPLEPGLYLVATPIGNLADITLRALAVLSLADEIYCEDTRHSRTLLSHYGLTTKLSAYHEHNAATERPRILAKLEAGRRIAVISDAGTPLISDPGFKLARSALDQGHRVISLPGPSAALAALTSSGLPSDCFLFAGFLPPRSGQRRTRLTDLSAVPATLVFFEAPQRLAETLEDMLAVLGDRPAAIARELTKLHEELRRGTLATLTANIHDELIRGEIAIVVGPPLAATATDDDIIAQLTVLRETLSLRDASRAIAERLGIAKTRVYDIGVKMKQAPNENSPSRTPKS